jgi:putative endonuclease
MFLIDTARRMLPSLSRDAAIVYILRLRSGALYIGCTTDFEVRLLEHGAGAAYRTTSLDPPDALLLVEIHPHLQAARNRELQLKRWSRAKTLALINGDLDALRGLSRSRD